MTEWILYPLSIITISYYWEVCLKSSSCGPTVQWQLLLPTAGMQNFKQGS